MPPSFKSNSPTNRSRRIISALCTILVLATTLGGCACRPGYIGPYGARPARCWIW